MGGIPSSGAVTMRSNAVTRLVAARSALALCGGLTLSACAAKYAQVPPRLDLQPYGRVALVTFSAERDNANLGTLATQRFAEELLSSQSNIELLELGEADSSLRKLAAAGDAGALVQALGREKNVPAVFLGQLSVSKAKPRGRITGSSVNVSASVAAELTVRLLSTSSGGTLWRSSAEANSTVGRLAISDRAPSIAMRDPDEAYGQVVDQLVRGVTRDLRPTWVKQ
jgi:hypothetical protein